MVRVVQDDVRQLLSLEVEETSGLKLRANSISDGTLRFLALAILTEVSEESASFLHGGTRERYPSRQSVRDEQTAA